MRMRVTIFLFLLILVPSVSLFAQQQRFSESIQLDIESHSGTPPVLEFVLRNPGERVRWVSFDWDSDGKRDLMVRAGDNEVVFRGIPFRKAGTYRIGAWLHTREGTLKREYWVTYTDFIWGRDNFQFANDGKFENSTDFVSDTVVTWALERFGPLDQIDRVLLLSVMYDIYKGSIGRCYGFTGEQIRYLQNPELIPPLIDSIYWMQEGDGTIFKDMDWIQNDIVFSNFLSGNIRISERQNRESLLGELDLIRESINRGDPIIIGYLSTKMHHSMVVYGIFEDVFQNKVTLLTANNWEREQKNNTFSEDAENIVIELGSDEPKLRWYDLTKKKFRYPRFIFAIQRADRYDLSLADLRALLEQTKSGIVQKDRTIIMVEKTEVAYIVDSEGKRRGYSKPRYFKELDDVSFKKIDYNYVFDVPSREEYRLVLRKRRYNKELKQYKEVNLFGIISDHQNVRTEVFRNIEIDDTEERVYLINRDGIRPE
jgi:hypothetical protein